MSILETISNEREKIRKTYLRCCYIWSDESRTLRSIITKFRYRIL